MKKTNKLGTGSAAQRKRQWPLVPYLQFLNGVFGEGDTVSNIEPANDVEGVFYVLKTEDDTGLVDTEGTSDTFENVNDEIRPDTPSTSRSSIGSKRVKLANNNEKIEELLPQSREEINMPIEPVSKMQELHDEIDLFYKSLAMTVKRLPRHLVLQAKLQHLQTVTELELQAERDASFPQS